MAVMDTLVMEHSLIRYFLDNLTLAMGKMESEELPPAQFFEKATHFARNFTDSYHHFKEEHVLFGHLAKKKGGEIDGQIDALRYQHERGRNFITEIKSALAGYAKGEVVQTTTVLENLAAYVHMLRHHIHKEDHVFYPMAREALTVEELAAIEKEFQAQEEKSGQQSFAEANQLLREMADLL